jgi:hypothetical protein
MENGATGIPRGKNVGNAGWLVVDGSLMVLCAESVKHKIRRMSNVEIVLAMVVVIT